MHCVAANLGLAQPWTFCPKSRGDVEALSCPFSSILKPALKDELNALTITKAWRVDNHQQSLEAYDQASALMPSLIPGGGANQFSYTALCCEGEPLVSLTARRTRQYPSDFGRASTYVETIDRAELVGPSVRLLRALKMHGLVEIEYKRDPRDGALKLLDVNPRVWGWQSLCGRAGVDYPYLLWLLANDRPLPRVKPIIGVRCVRLSTDLPNALRDATRSRSNPVAYLRTFIGGSVEESVFALDDLWPALLELPLIFGAAGRRLLMERPV